MRRFVVVGADRATGLDAARVIESATEQQARDTAHEQGLVVNKVFGVGADGKSTAVLASAWLSKWFGIAVVLLVITVTIPRYLETLYLRQEVTPALKSITTWTESDWFTAAANPRISVQAMGESRAIVVVEYPSAIDRLGDVIHRGPPKFYLVEAHDSGIGVRSIDGIDTVP